MSRPLWFKRRRYGFGWTPVTTEGWAVVVAYLVIVIGGGIVLGLSGVNGNSTVGVISYFVVVGAATVALYLISRRHGPEPRWRWGRSSEDDPDLDF